MRSLAIAACTPGRVQIERDHDRSNDVLLMSFYGNQGNVSFKDEGPKANTVTTQSSGVQHSQTRSRWFGGSLEVSNRTSAVRIQATTAADFQFGTGAFQIRMNVLLNSSATDDEILAQRDGTTTPNDFWLIRKVATTNVIRVFAKTGGTTVTDISTSAAFPTGGNTFHDLEVRRPSSGAAVEIWIDGIKQALTTTTNSSSSWPNSSAFIYVGNGDNTLANGATGNYAWLRIKKGSAPTPEGRAMPPAGRYPIPLY